jgi:hypothetical protein
MSESGSAPAKTPETKTATVTGLSLRRRAVIVVGWVLLACGIGWRVSTWAPLISRVILPSLLAGAGVLLIITLWKLPRWQVAHSAGLTTENRFDRENEARKTLAQILGGIFLLAGLYSSVETLSTVREDQITDRFTKAIEQLGAVDSSGNPKLEVRLGAIYALERIARDSERDHGPIMEVLTAYVRANASRKDVTVPVRTDIQAIITVLGRRERRHERGDQRRTLTQIPSYPVNEEDAKLGQEDTALKRAFVDPSKHPSKPPLLDLKNTDLTHASFSLGDFTRVDFTEANLTDAKLSRATLADADFTDANLTRADFAVATLTKADFTDANLTRADFVGANLAGANLADANLADANLAVANLADAFLAVARNLTQDQINRA